MRSRMSVFEIEALDDAQALHGLLHDFEDLRGAVEGAPRQHAHALDEPRQAIGAERHQRDGDDRHLGCLARTSRR